MGIMMRSKRRISRMMVSRQIGVSYKTAWLMCRRLEQQRDSRMVHRIIRALKDHLRERAGDETHHSRWS